MVVIALLVKQLFLGFISSLIFPTILLDHSSSIPSRHLGELLSTPQPIFGADVPTWGDRACRGVRWLESIRCSRIFLQWNLLTSEISALKQAFTADFTLMTKTDDHLVALTAFISSIIHLSLRWILCISYRMSCVVSLSSNRKLSISVLFIKLNLQSPDC